MKQRTYRSRTASYVRRLFSQSQRMMKISLQSCGPYSQQTYRVIHTQSRYWRLTTYHQGQDQYQAYRGTITVPARSTISSAVVFSKNTDQSYSVVSEGPSSLGRSAHDLCCESVEIAFHDIPKSSVSIKQNKRQKGPVYCVTDEAFLWIRYQFVCL